jgi:stage II sporulation protein Q
MQNSGIDYSGTKEFEATAILDGSIINVEEHNLLGNIVEIRHTNDFISIYQCLLDVKVKEGDSIEQGQLIGKSGICNITPDLKNHLHFEILYKGRVVDPETFYDKTVKEL